MAYAYDAGPVVTTNEEEKKKTAAQQYLEAWQRRQAEIDKKSPGTGWGGTYSYTPTPVKQEEEERPAAEFTAPVKEEEPTYGEEEPASQQWQEPKAEKPTYTAPQVEATETKAGNMEAPKVGGQKAADLEAIWFAPEKKVNEPKTTAADTKAQLTGEEEDDTPAWMKAEPRRSGEERAEAAAPKYTPPAEPRRTGEYRAEERMVPYTPRPANNGYVPTNILQSEDYNRKTPYSPANTLYGAIGQTREVGIDQNGIYDRPLRERRAGEYRANERSPQVNMYSDDGLSWAGNTTGQPEAVDPEILAAYRRNVEAWKDSGATQAEAEANARASLSDQMGRPAVTAYVPPATVPKTQEQEQQPYKYMPELTGQERIENEQLNYERGLKEYTENNGAHTASDGSVPIADWFNKGQKENAVYDAAYQSAYDQILRKGGSYQDATAAAEKAGNDALAGYKAEQPAKEQRTETTGPDLFTAITNTANQPADYTYVPPAQTTEPKRSGEIRAEERMVPYTPSTTTTPARGTGANTNPERQGANAEVNTWNPNPDYAAARERQAERDAKRAGATTGTTAGTTAGTTSGTTTTGTTSGSSSDVPKGSQYFRPSYGQNMERGVKAPYKAGGYSEEELMKMGNAAYGTAYGKNAYEGYYLAPNGKYYPVDQVKADYYRKNGYSYDGWEEGMRDYYNTFGTFYGYKKNWNRGSGGGGYRYYGSGSSGNRYYGSSGSGSGGSNNGGLYWNTNTSWSI